MFLEIKSTKELEEMVLAIIEAAPTDRDALNLVVRKLCATHKINRPPNRALISAYHSLIKKKRIKKDKVLESHLVKANIRSLSGVSIITSLIKPYACPGECVYCPTEVKMPKSYIATEPAAARALRLDFSPYEQMDKRIKMLEVNGHSSDKIEFIIKGGTWNAYPIKYQYWFILESFKACNNRSRHNPIESIGEKEYCKKPLAEIIEDIEKEQRYNEHAKYRIIGITLETRPDAITPKTIYHMRRQGCTRIELGLQAPDDAILNLIKRGHTVQQFIDAMKLLREAGFKVDLHFMPDLPGTTPDHDVEMYQILFDNPGLKPDMVKIYPNTVIKSAELYNWFKDGRYTPYGEKGLFDALLQMKLITPRYCRISRLIRDIPSNEIYAGNTITNLREDLEKFLHKQNKVCVCLRCREIGRQRNNVDATLVPQIFVDTYETVGGTEFFISLEDEKRTAVYGFLRLRIFNEEQNKQLIELLPEIKNVAYVRELHIYGTLVSIGKKNLLASQHQGLGKRLMKEAEEITSKHNIKKLAVISGVGVRGYYRKLGYKKQGTYMIKTLNKKIA